VTYATLECRVWSRHADPNPTRVHSFVRTLHRKLGDDTANPAYILNERGVGYSMPEAGGL